MKRNLNKIRNQSGFTLMELVIVIVILGILSLVAMQSFSKRAERQRSEATLAEMEAIKMAIVGDPDKIQTGVRVDFGYVGDVGALPANLAALMTNPGVGNWNGPYMEADFVEDPADYATDAFGQAYVYNPATLTLYSPGANVTIQIASSTAELFGATVKALITDRDGFTPKTTDVGNIAVYITLQNGTMIGSPGTPNVATNGTATLAGIPIGNHILQGFHSAIGATGETVTYYLSVNPGAGVVLREVVFSSLPE